MITLSHIATIAAQEWGITLSAIRGPGRVEQCAHARFAAVWVARHMTNHSFPSIGRYFDRDHTSMLNAYQRAEHLRKVDADFRMMSDDVMMRCQEPDDTTNDPLRRAVIEELHGCDIRLVHGVARFLGVK